MMMASPLILCRTVAQPLQLLVVLITISSLCLAPNSCTAAPSSLPHATTDNSTPTSSSSSHAAAAATAPMAIVIAAALERRDALAPSALNSPPPPRRLLIPSLLAAEPHTANGGPPLIVGSDGAQRFFDRLHGFVDDKPVAAAAAAAMKRQPTTTTTKGIVESRSVHDGDDAIVDAVALQPPQHHDDDAAAVVDVVDAFAANRQNWILQQAASRKRHNADDQQQSVEAINGVGGGRGDAGSADARQMYASLSERIIGQLAAGNPWVNWTQSTGPVVVHSIANVPIGQFPFVLVQPTQAPAATPAKDQQPPRRGWLSFQRPWRIYGEGTEAKFPPVLERVVQRIQNYFSVFKYQDQSRPLPGQPATSGGVVMDAVEEGSAATVAGLTQSSGPLVIQDEIITPGVVNSIEIDAITVSDLEETTSEEATTVSASKSPTESQRTEEIPETTTIIELGLERLNEIAARSDQNSFRNDKIIKIEQFNKV